MDGIEIGRGEFLAAKETSPSVSPAPEPVAAPVGGRARQARRTGRPACSDDAPACAHRERMVQAQATQALLTSFNESTCTRERAALALQGLVRETARNQARFMSFFTKACIEALKKFPSVNASVEGNDIVYHEYFDVGVRSPRTAD